MNDTIGGQITLLLVSWVAFFVPFIFAPLVIGSLTKEGKKAFQAMSHGLKNAANKSARMGKRAAMGSKYGQAAQQFMGNRKSIAALKGREALRGTLEKNPNLMKLMGGPGGGKYAARYLDAEQRKHESEQVSNLQQGLTGNVADAMARGEPISNALRTGKWASGREVKAADRTAISKLQQEGYMDQNYNAKMDPHLAKASLGSIMSAEIATNDNINGLAKNFKGRSEKENTGFTEMLQAEAGKHGYKNFQYADVTNGEVDKYYVKSGGREMKPDGTMETPDEAAARGAKKVVDSGLSGINKDAFDPSMDRTMLNALKAKHEKAVQDGQGDAFVRKIAEQTKHIDKEGIVNAIAVQLGGGTITVDGKVQIQDDGFVNDFKALRSSIKSGGAIEPPARFTAGGGTPAQAPAPAPTPAAAPPPPGYQQAPGSPLIVPHSPAPAPRPRPGGNFNNPNPPNNPPGGGISS